jgi:hypothetical protein
VVARADLARDDQPANRGAPHGGRRFVKERFLRGPQLAALLHHPYVIKPHTAMEVARGRACRSGAGVLAPDELTASLSAAS